MMFTYINRRSCFVQVYSFDAVDEDLDDWDVQNGQNAMFRNCGSQKIFGGPKSFGMSTSITRFFNNIDPHSSLKIEMEFWRIDKWTSDSINIEVDNNLQFQKDYIQSGIFPDYCGTGSLQDDDDDTSVYDDEHEIISFTIPHSKRSAWVHIYTNYNNDEKQSWGLRIFKLSIKKCQNGCLACSIDDYPECLKWERYIQSFSNFYLSGLDQWNGLGSPLTLWQSNQCSNCHYYYGLKFRRYLYLTKQNQLLLRLFKFDSNDFKILLDNKQYTIIYNKKGHIEILIDDWKSDILDIRFVSLNQELYLRDIDIYIANSNDNDIIGFQQGCEQFINNLCNICNEGWIYNEINNSCQGQCGDQVIEGDEECDDGNNQSNDGCFQCKFQCDQNCNICLFGVCQNCLSNYELDDNKFCQSICGDGVLIPYTNEQCDDGNDIENDGCYNCIFECNKTCNICFVNICLECQKGYHLIDNECQPFCGDSIVIIGSEDCDDGNQIPFDGCYNCKFQCYEDCLKCLDGLCIDDYCNKGYELISEQCISICGDQLITIDEECDDNNDIQYDGCYQCLYSCPLNCFNCLQGLCVKCEYQYQLTQNGLCQITSQLQDIIQCYDGNDLPNDGCYNSKIETNWVCSEYIQDILSQCSFSLIPQIILTFLNITSNIQYVKISFNEQVIVSSSTPLSQTIEIIVLNITNDKQKLNLSIIQDVNQDFSNPEFIITIEIYQLLQSKPILQILLNQQIVNRQGSFIPRNDHYISLNIPNYLNELQTTYSYKLQQVNKSIIYTILAIGAVCLLFGFSNLFLQILNILQYQQYLRYLNLQFPQNLSIYFELGDLLSSQTLMDYFHIGDFFSFFSINSRFQPSYEKFEDYELNADLIQNIQWQVLQFCICLLILSIISFLKRIFYYHIFTSSFCDSILTLLKCIKKQFIIKFASGIYKLAKQFISIEQVATYNGVKQLLLINGWDLLFKVFLYLQSINSIFLRDVISIFIGSCILLAYLIIIISACNRQTRLKKIRKKLLLVGRFEIFNLLRQFCFLIILVFLQEQQILQIMLITLICVLCLKIVYIYRNAFQISNFLVQFIVEGSILVFTFTSLIYVNDFSKYINQELKIKFGWFHISILSFALIVQLIMIIYQRIQSLYSKYKHEKEKRNQARNNSHLLLIEIKNRIIIHYA
ncbi:unnamed protein product [Paramecium sonneborni]|uniref:Insulin-like growth factor binding protein, N-terminal n=1 Tax=Paramecium sonneborni TaxID=65129 RepID=A0A8S1RJL1_9CILI|nr:unnamed protein product [Paramecium sonneborni]